MKAAPIPGNETERLLALRRYAVLDTPAELGFDDLTKVAAHILGVPIALISLVDSDRQWFKARYGLDAPQTPRDVSFCGHVVAEQDTLVVQDAFADERFHDNPLVRGEPRVRFYAGAPLQTPDGYILGSLCAIDHQQRAPTAEQIAMLQALARQAVQLLEFRRQANLAANYKKLFDASNSWQAIAGFNGYFKQINPSWSQVLGYTREELLSKSFFDLVHPHDAEATLAEAKRLAEGNAVGAFDNRCLSKDGSYRWLSWYATADTAERRIYAVGTDITNRKQLEEMKNEFVSVVSHELRTPLTSIRGALRLLEGGVMGELSSAVLELVQVAISNCERLIRLINDILDLDRIESGKMEMDIETLDIAQLVDKAAAEMTGMAADAGVEIEIDCANVGVAVLGDADRVVQVLVNLISNAVKFSPENAKVCVHAGQSGRERIRVSVRDQGPGIAQADAGRLFDKFEQLDLMDNRKRGGTGLGLAIARAIVEEHGGKIGVDSIPGDGSTFWFELPAAHTLSDLQTIADDRQGYSVLLVEDDAGVSHVLSLLLRSKGYQVRCAESLAAAEQVLAATPFDAILLDIGLPDGSGLDLLTQIKNSEILAEIPCIVTTAQPKGRDLGVPLWVDWLQKPIDEERLLKALHRALRSAERRPRVLAVEDDPDSLQILVMLLQRLGVEYLTASSGGQALKAVDDFQPDLIILDVGLPHGDGFEVVQALRTGKARSTPLLVYSGRDLDKRERDALVLGITRYLTKSRVSEEQFMDSVTELLNGFPRDE